MRARRRAQRKGKGRPTEAGRQWPERRRTAVARRQGERLRRSRSPRALRSSPSPVSLLGRPALTHAGRVPMRAGVKRVRASEAGSRTRADTRPKSAPSPVRCGSRSYRRPEKLARHRGDAVNTHGLGAHRLRDADHSGQQVAVDALPPATGRRSATMTEKGGGAGHQSAGSSGARSGNHAVTGTSLPVAFAMAAICGGRGSVPRIHEVTVASRTPQASASHLCVRPVRARYDFRCLLMLRSPIRHTEKPGQEIFLRCGAFFLLPSLSV